MHRLAALLFLLLASAAPAQSLRFFASPYEVYAGDAVVFNYLEADRTSPAVPTVRLSQIISWRWDFNGDVQNDSNPNDSGWDESFTVGDSDPNTGLPITVAAINATWISALDSRAVDGVQSITPKLQVTYQNGASTNTITQTGVTENVFGTDSGTWPAGKDSTITVKDRGVGNADLSVSFSVNPRLASTATVTSGGASVSVNTLRFYPEVSITAAAGRTVAVTSYSWLLHPQRPGAGNDVPLSGQYPTQAASGLASSSVGEVYDVTLTVGYSLTVNGTTTSGLSIQLQKTDAFRVVSLPASLQLGRAYRIGFPSIYGWDDIVKAYSATGSGNDDNSIGYDNNYIYFNHFQQAFFDQQNALVGVTPSDPLYGAKRQTMAEIVNELLQGQSMIANQRLIEALRIKYPRISADVDPNTERLNPPAGTRDETAAIDTAILDYHAAVQFGAAAIRDYGSDILRSKAATGAEPFPQFPLYLTITDPTLSKDAPIPIKNEYWQLTTAFERMELGRVEKAKKLWKLSTQDSTALPEAKAECKTAGTQSYLAMAMLAAGQSESDYQSNEGNLLLAHVKNARDIFENINAGVNPIGNDGSFIPNESFASIYQDATEAVGEARTAEINARQESRLFKQYQKELRDELQSQRAQFITPLYNLTGLDPALYNDLKTVDDRNDYRRTIATNVLALLATYPDTDISSIHLGDFGNQVIAILDGELAIDQAVNRLKNNAAAIDISTWANTEIKLINQNANVTLRSHDIARGYANSVSTSDSRSESWSNSFGASIGASYGSTGVSVSVGVNYGYSTSTSNSTSTSYSLGSITSGYLNAEDRDIQVLQQAQIGDIQLEAETRKSLLEIANLRLDIRRAENALNQQKLKLDQMLTLMSRYIEDLAHARDTAASLYFQDPTFQVVVSTAMHRAEAEIDYSVDKLYRLAKTLGYEWTENYQNPVIIPANSSEPASLENVLFDKFTNVDSLFFVRTADECYDYLGALKAWDSKLRRINVVSVRGPNHSGPISAEPISMREMILGLKPDATRGYTLDDSIRDFRNFLETKRVANYYNTANPSLQVEFVTEIDDNTFFPATGSRWNMRINSIAADTYAESGFSDKQVIEYDLIQSGTVSLRRYWASLPLADDVMRLRFYVDNPDRSAFAIAFPSRINGATGGRPLTEFDNLGLADRPVAATRWILRVNTENPTNRNVNFSKIKDIVLRYTYTFGNPAEFPNF